MKPEDYDSARRLWEVCFKDYNEKTRKNLLKLLKKDRILFLLNRNPKLSVVCEDRGKIVGTLLGSFDSRYVLLHHLAVHPNYRGMGLGVELNKALEKRIKELKPLKILFFCRKRRKLLKYYKKMGFRKSSMVLMYKRPKD